MLASYWDLFPVKLNNCAGSELIVSVTKSTSLTLIYSVFIKQKNGWKVPFRRLRSSSNAHPLPNSMISSGEDILKSKKSSLTAANFESGAYGATWASWAAYLMSELRPTSRLPARSGLRSTATSALLVAFMRRPSLGRRYSPVTIARMWNSL